MKKIIFTTLASMLWTGAAYSQQLPGDSLANDFRTLVRHLEQTHPDPYSAFGGKVFFRKEAYEIGQKLKAGATREEFAATALTFLSRLNDGHTWISGGEGTAQSASNLRLPLKAIATSYGMVAIELPEEHSELTGSRVVSVNGVTIEELAQRIGRLTPVENKFGAYRKLSSGIMMHRLIMRLIDGVGESVVVELETASGNTTTITLDYLSPEDYAALPKTVQPKWAAVDESEYMSYGFLDKGRRAMLFRLANMVSHEAMADMRQSGFPGLEDQLAWIYPIVMKRQMPADIDAAIEAFPSLAATFRSMLTEMKEAGAPYLIIDLRNNDGGFTTIVYATLYQLWGDRYFETEMGDNYYKLISPLVLEKYGVTPEGVDAFFGRPYELGDYTFGDGEPDSRTTEQKRADFVNNIYGGDPTPVADMGGKSIYTPERVFVITNDGTFSAALHYAFYLWKMGATVVGVPSSQAPNAFMEVTPFTLPYTGLRGSISNSAQVYLPTDDPRANVFWPDIMLTPDDYRRYGFDRHAELLYLMDHLELDK